MAHGIDGIAEDLLTQAEFLKDREPAYDAVLRQLERAVRGELGARLAGVWAERAFHAGYERPLLLLAALRYDALSEGPSHPLHAAIGRSPGDPAAVTEHAVAEAVSGARARFTAALSERAVQTNETTRAVAWLWPAQLLASAGERRALALVDLGTSAGLNLIADELPAPWVDASGRPLVIEPRPEVAVRLGLDIAPLDVRAEDAATWLRACVWPSDAARLSRLELGIERFRARCAAGDGPRLETSSLDEAPARISRLPSELLVLAMQSIVRDYLPEAARTRYERGMRELLATRPPRTMLWAELELDQASDARPEYAAALTVRYCPAPGALRERVIARTHPHPQRLFVDEAAVSALLDDFRARP